MRESLQHSPVSPATTGEALLARLGLDASTRYFVQRREGWRRGRGTSPSRKAWTRAFDGAYSIALDRSSEAACIILDVDVAHDLAARLAADSPRTRVAARRELTATEVPRSDDERARLAADLDSAVASGDLDAWLRADKAARPTKAASMRAFVAANGLRAASDRLRELEIAHHAMTSPRGGHLVILLTAPAPVGELAALGKRLLALLPSETRACAEVFPTADGRMCRTPCSGPSRVLGPDLVGFAHRRRADDRKALAYAPGMTIAALRARLAAAELAAPPLATSDRSDMGAPRRRTKGKALAPGQLSGRDFAAEVLRFSAEGMAKGGSWNDLRRFAFAGRITVGLPATECLAGFAVLVARSASNHCQTEAGRRSLVATFLGELRRLEGGIARGELRPGRGSDRRLRETFARLLEGREPAPTADAPPRPARSRRPRGPAVRIQLARLDDPNPIRRKIAAAREERRSRALRASAASAAAREAEQLERDEFFEALDRSRATADDSPPPSSRRRLRSEAPTTPTPEPEAVTSDRSDMATEVTAHDRRTTQHERTAASPSDTRANMRHGADAAGGRGRRVPTKAVGPRAPGSARALATCYSTQAPGAATATPSSQTRRAVPTTRAGGPPTANHRPPARPAPCRRSRGSGKEAAEHDPAPPIRRARSVAARLEAEKPRESRGAA